MIFMRPDWTGVNDSWLTQLPIRDCARIEKEVASNDDTIPLLFTLAKEVNTFDGLH